MSENTREQLHRQIDQLPDRALEVIAKFIQSVETEHPDFPEYANWKGKDWQAFSIQQFSRDQDEVEYSIEDAQEVVTAKAS